MKDKYLELEKIIEEKCSKDIQFHSERTKDIALILQEIYGGDKEAIIISALLHDVAAEGEFKHHAEEGSKIIRETFKDRLNSSLLDKVCYCVRYHSIASPKPLEITPELICVRDADKIDFLLTTSNTNSLYDEVSRSFLGNRSLDLYKKLERIVKWYKK